MNEDDRPAPAGMEALRQRFQEQSRKAQAYYAVMHKARAITGSDEAASAWMEQGLPAFGGRSPALLVREGLEAEVLDYLGSLGAASGG